MSAFKFSYCFYFTTLAEQLKLRQQEEFKTENI